MTLGSYTRVTSWGISIRSRDVAAFKCMDAAAAAALQFQPAQITGDDCNKRKKHDEWGYASMFLHHISDLKMLVSKSGRQPFAQEAPRVPQISPKGPKFGSRKISHTIPR